MIWIHSLESMGTFDGPGLRLVVFMQGCNFKCLYCANPDTIGIRGGKQVAKEEILRRALSEKAFFGRRGGITFSGGEPTLQAKDLIPLFRDLKENGIHICLDTNGSIMNSHVRELLSLTDMVLLDVKGVLSERHERLINAKNDQVYETAKLIESMKIPMRIRCVMVPGYNDSIDDIRAIGEKYRTLTNIDRIEVLPYHTYGVHKYEALGWEYELKNVKEHSQEKVEALTHEFEKYFPKVWTQY